MPGANADEIDELGSEISERAQELIASAHARRESASGPLHELDKEIAAVEERTAIEIEKNEETLHRLADIKRRAEAIPPTDS